MILMMVMLLVGCGSKTIVDEPYEPVDYNLYPIPKDAYVGDTMPFVTEDGQLELYYLYDTDHNGQGYHPIYKYSTKDLLSYQDHGLVLNYGLMQDPDPAIGTGSVVQDKDGKYHLFYTGHNDVGNGGKGKECIMHAISDDRMNFTKVYEDTFYAPDGYSKDDFRDPEVFYVEEEDCYWMLVAARNNAGGIVARYTSTDLKNWNLEDPLYAPHAQYMLECPDLFKMNDKWYLTYSWDCVTYYAMSNSMNGPFEAPMDNIFDGNRFIFYAAKTAELNGHRYLCGWLGRAGLSSDSGIYQWAGSILNHELVQKEDGTLGVKAPSTFDDYFVNEKQLVTAKKQGQVKIKNNSINVSAKEDKYALVDLGTRNATMSLECDVVLNQDSRIGFAFGGKNGDDYYVLSLDAINNLISYEGLEISDLEKFLPETYTKYDFSKLDTHHVKLVCENEIVILYIDDTKAFSSRIGNSTDGAHLYVFAESGSGEFSNISIKLP